MKRISVFSFLAAILISIGSACAHAQSTVEARIPFSFNVNGKVLPAGTYQVGYASPSRQLIVIRSKDRRFSMLNSAFAADDHGYSGLGKLVFTQYGNQYFLHTVLCSALAMNAEIPVSKMEKRLRIEIAAQHPPSQTTVAALAAGEK